MAISYPPSQPPSSTGEVVTTIVADTKQQTFAANPGRISGYILNTANKTASVFFGAGQITAGAANTTPVPAASGGVPGAIDIPQDFDGAVQIIWPNGVSTTAGASLHEMI